MRLKKLSLIAAAGVSFALSASAAGTRLSSDASLTNLSGSGDYILHATDTDLLSATTLTINNTANTTYSGRFLGFGNVIKTGSGTLEYAGFRDTDYYGMRTFVGTTVVGAGENPQNDMFVRGAAIGDFRIEQGTVNVSGLVSQYVQYDDSTAALRAAAVQGSTWVTALQNRSWVGFSRVILEGSSKLTFKNTPLNVGDQPIKGDDKPDAPSVGTKRYNFIRNLVAGVDATGAVLNTANQTELESGPDASYRLIIQQEAAASKATPTTPDGAVGILSGQGRIFKTGSGSFSLLNASRFTGDMLVVNGTMILGSSAPGSYTSINSVNIGARVGSEVVEASDLNSGGWTTATSDPKHTQYEWKPAYVEGADTTARAVLQVKGSQTIGSLQSLFWENPEDRAGTGTAAVDEPYRATTGKGRAHLAIDPDATLTVTQREIGYYTGSIEGGGKLVKEGAAQLVLLGSSSDLGELRVNDGTLTTNLSMVGQGNIFVGDGLSRADGTPKAARLEIVENSAVSLYAKLASANGGSVVFQTRAAFFDPKGNLYSIGDGTAPTIELAVPQTTFYGNMTISSGITLVFGGQAGDDVLINASGVTLHDSVLTVDSQSSTISEKPATLETTLKFKDTNQGFHNFQGDPNTAISLGRGTVTLYQDSFDTGYSGKIFGTGGFIKAGSKTLSLSGRDGTSFNGVDNTGFSKDTYAGATIVRAGTLKLEGVNQLPNSSGLVLAGGVLDTSGKNQTFGGLFGSSGSVLNFGGATLTIGLTSARLAQVQAEAASFAGSSGYYLATEGSTAVTGYNGDTTRTFLRASLAPGADVAAANADYINDLAYAGKLVGTGTLVKQGAERLNLTGVSTEFKGAVQVDAGTLQVTATALPNVAGIRVGSAGTFAVNAGSLTDGTGNQIEQAFAASISGSGSFEKSGLGTTRLVSPLALTGSVSVKQGTLILSLADATARNYAITNGATLTLDQSSILKIAGGAISGAGTLRKTGSGAVDFSSVAIGAFAGNIELNAGSMVLPSLISGNLALADGTVMRASVANNPIYNGKLSGAGRLEVSSGTLLMGAASDDFRGVLSMTSGAVVAGQSDLFKNGTLELHSASTFNLNGTTQTVSGLAGDITSSIVLGGGTLRLASPADTITEFSGLITGTGALRKTGAGEFRLTGTVNTQWGDKVYVDDGRLVATPQSLGTSTVIINPAGTFALHNTDTVNAVTFENPISGDGAIDKTGAGVVTLLSSGAVSTTSGFSGSVQVSEGELRVDSTAASLPGIGGKVFPNVSVAKNAAYAVVLTGATTLDFTDGNKVSGEGSLAVEGGKTLTLQGAQLYSGNTILRGAGTTLDLRTGGITTINGLDSGTTAGGIHIMGSGAGTVVNAGSMLVIAQNTAGTFDGTLNLLGGTAVSVTGAAKLYLTNPGVYDYTVDGGNLQLDAAATNAVTLANGGTLYSAGGLYDAAKISGSGNVMLSDVNQQVVKDLADTQALAYAGKLGVDAGSLQVEVAGLGANITGLISNKSGSEQEVTGTLKLSVGASKTTLATSVSGNGALEKVGAGTLVINDTATRFLKDFTGTFTVTTGTLSGTFMTSGDLVVASDAHLAPGNSPGLVTVNGNLTLAGQLDMEVTNKNATAGVDFDQVVVKALRDGSGTMIPGTGVATLGGALRVTQYGSVAPVRGVGYQLITAEGGITGDFASVDTSVVGGVAGRRVLIVTPSRSADVNGALFGLGSSNAVTIYVADTLGATSGYTPHEGLSGLNGVLDSFVYDETANNGTPANALGARLAVSAPASLDATVNAISPLGYGALYAMDRETGLRQEERIRERLEQRRYDNSGERNDPWEAFVVGSGSIAENKSERDTPTFNYNTFGGLVGLDKKLERGPVVGGAAGFDTGSATLHQGAGKIEMSRVRATAFVSSMVNSRWYLDAGISAGYADFTSKRETLTGRNTGNTTGYDVGASLATGTVVALREDLHLTPFAAISYSHHEFAGFTEKGSVSRLKLDGWSQDSLRTSVGSGIGWWLPAGDMKVKLGLDLAYNHELLDTESDLDARFAQLGGSSFSTSAAALPSDSISVGPNISLGFDEVTSVSAGYTYEMGFDGRAYHSFNVTFRRRF